MKLTLIKNFFFLNFFYDFYTNEHKIFIKFLSTNNVTILKDTHKIKWNLTFTVNLN